LGYRLANVRSRIASSARATSAIVPVLSACCFAVILWMSSDYVVLDAAGHSRRRGKRALSYWLPDQVVPRVCWRSGKPGTVKQRATSARLTVLAVLALLAVVLFAWLRSEGAPGNATSGAARATSDRSASPSSEPRSPPYPPPSRVAAAVAIDGVRFDTSGWTRRDATASKVVWADGHGDAMVLKLVPGPAPVPFDSEASVQAWARQEAAQNGGGIVSARLLHIGDVPVVEAIYKHETRPAYEYLGAMIIPGAAHHFRIAVGSAEIGKTGVRDALVTAQLVEQGRLDPRKTDEKGRILGWFRDPYDARFDSEALNCVADDEQYDSLVPSHPLSVARRTLHALAATLTFSG
jgi:hypothetical protein